MDLLLGVDGILHGVDLGFVWLGIGIMAFSAVAKFFVSRWLISKARTEDSRAIEEGHNLRADVWAEGGVGAGLVLAWATG